MIDHGRILMGTLAQAFTRQVRAAWQALGSAGRLDLGESERNLETARDRFELERRERTYSRRQSSEASLLGG
jgi:hypothetical protein